VIPNINLIEVHSQLSHNGCPMDGARMHCSGYNDRECHMFFNQFLISIGSSRCNALPLSSPSSHATHQMFSALSTINVYNLVHIETPSMSIVQSILKRPWSSTFSPTNALVALSRGFCPYVI